MLPYFIFTPLLRTNFHEFNHALAAKVSLHKPKTVINDVNVILWPVSPVETKLSQWKNEYFGKHCLKIAIVWRWIFNEE